MKPLTGIYLAFAVSFFVTGTIGCDTEPKTLPDVTLTASNGSVTFFVEGMI